MIIWGSKSREKIVAQGQFYCPRCRILRPYYKKRISRYFTIYFIPIFETKLLAEFIECDGCGTYFKPEVLQNINIEKESQFQNQIIKVIREISNQLEAGVPINFIITSLKEADANEDTIKSALYAATEGKISECENCRLVYKASLAYCSRCGRPLKRISTK